MYVLFVVLFVFVGCFVCCCFFNNGLLFCCCFFCLEPYIQHMLDWLVVRMCLCVCCCVLVVFGRVCLWCVLFLSGLCNLLKCFRDSHILRVQHVKHT